MKIVHALAYYGNYLGGIQLYVHELSKRQRQRGHAVTIITSDRHTIEHESGDIDVIRTKTPFTLFRVPFTPFLPFTLLHTDCDVLHVHLPLPWLDLCAALKKRLHPKTRLILTIHNYIHAARFPASFLAALHNSVTIQTALQAADKIITTTSSFLNSLPYKLPAHKCCTIPLGVDTDFFKPTGAAVNSEQVLFVGRLIPEKGLHILVEAMKVVSQSIPAAKLVAVYQDVYQLRDYKRQIIELSGPGVIHKENFPRSELPDLFSRSACLVMPSVDLDSFGMVLLEAMACGCPVICSDLPGPSEVVAGVGNIYPKKDVTQLARTIIEVLQQKLDKNGRKRLRNHVMEKYSWDHITDMVIQAYNDAPSA